MARPKGTTRAKKPIDKYEYDKLIQFVKKSSYIKQQRLRVKLVRLFTLLYVTGCRINEVIDFDTKVLKIMIEAKEYSLLNNTKTNSARLIVLSDNQIEILKTILPNENKTLFDVSVQYLTIKANDVIHKCLGKLYSTHSFRAGYATRLYQSSKNLKLVQEDLDHKKASTTLVYTKVTDSQKREEKSKIKW